MSSCLIQLSGDGSLLMHQYWWSCLFVSWVLWHNKASFRSDFHCAIKVDINKVHKQSTFLNQFKYQPVGSTTNCHFQMFPFGTNLINLACWDMKGIMFQTLILGLSSSGQCEYDGSERESHPLKHQTLVGVSLSRLGDLLPVPLWRGRDSFGRC